MIATIGLTNSAAACTNRQLAQRPLPRRFSRFAVRFSSNVFTGFFLVAFF
jgi:hypothetical protein